MNFREVLFEYICMCVIIVIVMCEYNEFLYLRKLILCVWKYKFIFVGDRKMNFILWLYNILVLNLYLEDLEDFLYLEGRYEFILKWLLVGDLKEV